MGEKNYSGAVIVCIHVISGKYPILLAERLESDDPVDTGWQFLCGMESHENVADAKIWALDEILEFEPTLKNLVNQPFGTRLTRDNENSPWIISKANSI